MKSILLVSILVLMLFITKTNAQTEEVFYYPKLSQMEMSDAKTNLKRVLETMSSRNSKNIYNSRPEIVSVFDDRFEITYKKPKNTVVFYFSDLPKYDIEVVKITTGTDNYEFLVRLGELTFSVYNSSNGRELPDYLFFFQHRINVQRYDSLIAIFKPVAAQYCAINLKPAVSEEQRKYIVQANVLNQQKMYNKAIEIYNKAIEIDQTAYPAAYSNVALLSALLHKFDAAIYYMKKYLMLEPAASDARGAQDKIYEWEILMQK